MVERTADGERTVGSCGQGHGGGIDDVPITDTIALRLCGRPLDAGDRRVLVAFAEQAAVALQQGRLTAQAAEADRLAAGNSMRTALLAAVSHDLRTPLAGIKAASSALRSTDLALTDDDRAELVATVDESADRLTGLVDNLLDMSRLQSGAVAPALSPTDLVAVLSAALPWLDGPQRAQVVVHSPDDLPAALADPGLLERVVANLVGNATQHAPSGPVDVRAGVAAGRVRVLARAKAQELRGRRRGRGARPPGRCACRPCRRSAPRSAGAGRWTGRGCPPARSCHRPPRRRPRRP
jgi:two-component system, OmpR family, sensor histidine kinase KdpD